MPKILIKLPVNILGSPRVKNINKVELTGIVMADNFRNVLIILSGIVIGAIFVHGLWTIRKQKNPYKLKTNKQKIEPLSRNFDGTGFDQDGVGKVKVSGQVTPNQTASQIDIEQSLVTKDVAVGEKKLTDELAQNSQENSADGTINHFETDELGDDITQFSTEKMQVKDNPLLKRSINKDPVYQQPVTQAKSVKKANKKPLAKAELTRNQMEINFESVVDELEENTPSIGLENANEKSTLGSEDLEPQVIVLSVVMPNNQQIMGAALLPSLLTLGMKYGDMNIFHRHQDNAGNGAVTFSLANMMNPGAFELDTMETFATQGVTLFMTLPNACDPFIVFEQMLAAAKQLAQEFNGQILDDKRNVMTKQTEQHYVGKIREFDRLSRIAQAEH